MNVLLMPHDVNLDFYFNPSEIYKSDDEIKSCFFNSPGSVIAIITKNNLIKLFDFFGKTCVFAISHFKENQDTIHFLSWSNDSKFLYVTYEDKFRNTRIKFIKLNFFDRNNYFQICDDILIYPNLDMKLNNTTVKFNGTVFLLISGPYPKLFDLSTGQFFKFFKSEDKIYDQYVSNQTDQKQNLHTNSINSNLNNMNSQAKTKQNSYNFILKETLDMFTYFLFVKETYLFFLLKDRNLQNEDKSKYLNTNIKEKKLTEEQQNVYEYVRDNLIEGFIIIDLYTINSSGEIIQANLDSTKSLILVNSSDRYIRLFNYNYDQINLIKEHNDSVNKRKWINAFFYNFKIKSNYQEVIVSALSDVNSLEFIFFDINTGKRIKNMEPFKYQCSDFLCHYMNHFSIILISNKKLFLSYGYLVNHFGALAPQFQYIEENIGFIEEEDFFDNFKKNLKNLQNKKKEPNHFAILKALEEDQNHNSNLFLCYSPSEEEDQLAIQSEKELKELFQNFNDFVEITKYEE